MADAPWDTSPSTSKQLSYIRGLAELVAGHDCSHLDRTCASGVIDKMNSVRRALGITVQDLDGTDGLQS